MAEPSCVLDASALLCRLFEEPGHGRMEAAPGSVCIAAADPAEVVGLLGERGVAREETVADLREVDLEVMPMDRAQAEAAEALCPATRADGLGLGQRPCPALAQSPGATALTTARAWAGLDGGIAVEVAA